MRSLTTIAAAAALVFPLAAAAPEPGTLQLNFHKRKVQATPDKLQRRQKANTVNSAISNEYNMYLINVTVGTPPQTVGLQLDTGSSDIWFPASNSTICRAGGCIYGSYNAAASSTYSNPGYGPFEIAYVDGTQVQGEYISDTLVVGGTTLTNLTMADALHPGNQQNGIMGIAFTSGESSAQEGFEYPNIIDVLVSEKKINTRAYSLWLDDLQSNTGSILFGGVDKNKYTGSLITIPMQRDSQTGNYTSFTVAWTGLTISGGGQTYNENPSSAQPVILDSGTTLTYLPADVANNIFNGVGVVTDNTYGNVVPCDLANDNLVFTYQFGGSSGPKVNVSISELVIGPITTNSGRTVKFTSGQYKGKTACDFGIDAASAGEPILFGDTFLRSAYVVYDLDNRQIGLAQTNQNSNTNEDDVAVYSSGTIMPDASTTVTGVTVSGTGAGSNGPQVLSTATATNDAGQGNDRTPTFSLASSTASSTGSKSAAPATIPSIQRSTLAVIGATVVAFVFGTMIL